MQQETYVERSQEVESLMETMRLTRKAIIEKLNPANTKKKRKKKSTKATPVDISKQDYDEVELDDLEDN